ncbi:cytochrome c [Phragmitibacter flavus]|uniref:Cytochrome c n=1 Tax=Phragmitibacter flavus TaxID=2576071 RepID=A0A5R8KF42_9BACT|nr:cytochrome c [Phragmitibacter flavus]TLD70229.1 cytochrome c [Phragmitibacter flavus]
MKYFFLSYLLVAITVVAFAGFRGHKFENTPFELLPDMDDQAKVKYQVSSNLFADGHAMRKPVAGTMPMGFNVPSQPASEGYTPQDIEFTHGTGYYYTGKMGDFYGDGLPPEVELTPALLERGRERYNINCAICHGESGNGQGIFVKYSTVVPANLTDMGLADPAAPTFRPDGKLYDVITHGWNQMGAYGANITVRDRWAIVAYLRTLEYAAKNPAK